MTNHVDVEVMDLAARIFDMARDGDTETLAAYLDAGVPVNLTTANGDTLVMLAAYYGHEATVAELIERGADVDRHNNRGQTPLAGTVFKNETTIMELLLEADADPLAGSPSALETARFFERAELARRLGHKQCSPVGGSVISFPLKNQDPVKDTLIESH